MQHTGFAVVCTCVDVVTTMFSNRTVMLVCRKMFLKTLQIQNDPFLMLYIHSIFNGFLNVFLNIFLNHYNHETEY